MCELAALQASKPCACKDFNINLQTGPVWISLPCAHISGDRSFSLGIPQQPGVCHARRPSTGRPLPTTKRRPSRTATSCSMQALSTHRHTTRLFSGKSRFCCEIAMNDILASIWFPVFGQTGDGPSMKPFAANLPKEHVHKQPLPVAAGVRTQRPQDQIVERADRSPRREAAPGGVPLQRGEAPTGPSNGHQNLWKPKQRLF